MEMEAKGGMKSIEKLLIERIEKERDRIDKKSFDCFTACEDFLEDLEDIINTGKWHCYFDWESEK